MAAPIDRLGELLGLARGYWDIVGVWHEPSEADRVALIEGLGWPIGDADTVAAEIERLETEAWRRMLPPVQVVRENAVAAVDVVLPSGSGAAWCIEREDGGVIAGRLEATAGETRVLGGNSLCKLRLELPVLPTGYHRLVLPDFDTSMALIVAPKDCFEPAPIAGVGRVWGLAVQLYTVRSARNWGIGDFTDLADLARRAGRAGADLIGINPLHAHSLSRPEGHSPYSPASRFALDPLSLDIEALPEFAASDTAQAAVAAPDFQATLAALRAAPLVDYPGVAAIKLRILLLAHEAFARAPAERRQAYEAFVAAGGEILLRYAQFEAVRAYHDAATGKVGWWDWPASPAPDDPALAGGVQFQLWLQFVADQQLRAAAAAGRDAGMRIGIYRDLAVGAARDSAETWSTPALASSLSIGAPPDAMSVQGQNWGLPAPAPRPLEAAGFEPFAALLRANMRHAGALRIDHAMSLARLFVIPPGKSGAAGSYLAYPFEALTGILALESRRHSCVVIGEDLGTVPEGFRAAMAAHNVLSYKVLAFERYPDGAFRSPADYPHGALATAATHDLPPLAGFWEGADIATRQRAGLLSDSAPAEADREIERQRLRDLMSWQGVTPAAATTQAVVDTLHRLIARSGSAIAMVQLDDMLGETESVNIPGTWDEYPNWSRKLRATLEDVRFDDCFRAVSAIFAAERPKV